MYVAVDPAFDHRRSHPRFQKVLKDMGLADASCACRPTNPAPPPQVQVAGPGFSLALRYPYL